MIFCCECKDDARLKTSCKSRILTRNGLPIYVKVESVWKKFYFISVTESLTSYFSVNFNDLSKTEERREFALEFSREFLSVAQREGIYFDENAVEDAVKRPQIWPAGTTTSIHIDFWQGETNKV